MGPRVAFFVALLTLSPALAAENVLTVYEAGKTGGNIYDGTQPKRGPKECYVTVGPAGQSREITISTDQPFRAKKQTVFVAGKGAKKFKVITFKIPLELPAQLGSQAPADDLGYAVKFVEEKKAKRVAKGGTTKLVVKYVGDNERLLRDSAEVTLTPDFVPVYAKADALTKWNNINRKAGISCDNFTQVKVAPARTAIVSVSDDDADSDAMPELAATQESFWQGLQGLCGKAYEHVQEQPVPSRPILDVRKCEEGVVVFGVHYLAGGTEEIWNRSQTWMISKAGSALNMRYTRQDSSTPGAKQSGWAAQTKNAGTDELQIFVPDEGTIELSPSLENFGWVVRTQADDAGKATLLYQAVEKTDEGEVSRGGYLFDLSASTDPPEEPPWSFVTAEQADGDPVEVSEDEPAEPTEAEPDEATSAADSQQDQGS